MTIVLFKDDTIYTDSFVVEDALNGNSYSSFREKVYKSPCGRWIMAKSGETPSNSDDWNAIYTWLDKALEKRILDNVLLSTQLAELAKDNPPVHKLISSLNDDTIILTRTEAFVFARGKIYDPKTNPFIAWGTGWIHATMAMLLGMNAAQAMQSTIDNIPSCGGPVHVYRAKSLKAFKKVKVIK